MEFEVKSKRAFPFYIVDNAVLDIYGPKIGPYGIAVYSALARYADHEGACYPSTGSIARKTGICRRKVVSTIQLLADFKLIEIERRHSPKGDRASNLYVLLPIDPVESLGRVIEKEIAAARQ